MPAVEVRSTPAPIRTKLNPAEPNASSSESDIPPSGPTTMATEPELGIETWLIEVFASGFKTNTASKAASLETSS